MGYRKMLKYNLASNQSSLQLKKCIQVHVCCKLSPSADISNPLPATQKEERLRVREVWWSFLVFVDGRRGGG
jgi:hypothetical protein